MVISIRSVRVMPVLGYRGHGKKYGVTPFGNGYTFRVNSFAVHFWRYLPE